jgi:hypothetical protein
MAAIAILLAMTVTVKLHVAAFLAASVAVITTVVVPTEKLEPEFKVLVTEGMLQLSVAAGMAHWPIDVAEAVVKVILAGQLAKTGLTVSLEQAVMMRLIVTVNEQVALLFLASAAV